MQVIKKIMNMSYITFWILLLTLRILCLPQLKSSTSN